MTISGWIFLGLSLALVWGLVAYCYHKVLTGSEIEQPPDSLGG